MPAPATVPVPLLDPWKEAALKVEEDRGEPIGRAAAVEVPTELRHYPDRRRFLAVQAAERREQEFETPRDFAKLVELIRRGEFVEVPPLGQDYLLYGVGQNASDEPFTYYDKSSGKSIALYATDDEFERSYAQMVEAFKQQGEEIAALGQQLKDVPRRERAARRILLEELAAKQKEASELRVRADLLASFYRSPAHHKILAAEYEELARLAQDFGGRSYNLQDATARKELRVRLLSFLRPQAFEVLKEIARAYHGQFKRYLPVTSLVRTEEYQRRLSANGNANATRIEGAPHTTGLAFDIYYHFMTAAEQNFLMTELAHLKDAGRVEALRELRDHFHVFAFAEGRPPDEQLVRNQIERRAKQAEQSQETAEKRTQRAPEKASARAARTGRMQRRAP